MAKFKLALLFFVASFHGGTTNATKTPLHQLVNDIADEVINYIQYNFLCKLDPLNIPNVNTGNRMAQFLISQIQVNGLQNIQRIEDVQVELQDPSVSSVNPMYNIFAKLGIRNITIEFRVKAMNIISKSLVDFEVTSGPTNLDVYFQLNVNPRDRKAQLGLLSIETLSAIDWNLSGKVLHSDWLLWAFENRIKKHIDTEITKGLTTGLIDAKEVLNKKIETLLYFFPRSDYCVQESKESCNNPINKLANIEEEPDFEPIYLVKGKRLLEKSSNYEIVLSYKSRNVGTIPAVMFYPDNLSNDLVVDGYNSFVRIPQDFQCLSVIKSDEDKLQVTFSNLNGNLFYDGHAKYESYFNLQPDSYKYFDLPNVKLQSYFDNDRGSSFYIKGDGIFRAQKKITDLPNIIGYFDGSKVIIRARGNDGSVISFNLHEGENNLKFAQVNGKGDTLGLYLQDDIEQQRFNFMQFLQMSSF